MNKKLRILAAGSFILTILVNALASIIPLNGLSTGEVSNLYFNIFTPATRTFSIWAVIYTLLLIFVIRLLLKKFDKTYKNILIYFTISNFINVIWIFTWHYLLIEINTVLILLLMITTGLIYLETIKLRVKDDLTSIAFSIYFAWLNVASVANIFVLMNSKGVPNNETYFIIAAAILLITTMFISHKYKDSLHMSTYFVAFVGILSNHISGVYWDKSFELVLYALYLVVVILGINILYLIALEIKRRFFKTTTSTKKKSKKKKSKKKSLKLKK